MVQPMLPMDPSRQTLHNNHPTQFISLLLKRAVAGGFAGTCSAIVGHPFDTVKVTMQIDNKLWRNYERQSGPLKHEIRGQRGLISPHRFKHLGITLKCAAQILRNEGVFAFYKGMLFPLLSSVPWTAATFAGYTVGEQLFESISAQPPGQFSNKKFLIGGFAAGFFSSFIACPIDRVKCLLQAQTKSRFNSSVRYKGPFHCALQVYKHEGFFYGNYKGFGITLWRRIPNFGIYFIVYENTKELCRKRRHSSKSSGAEILLAGGMGGTTACIFSIAPDTIKTRVQTAQPGQYPRGMRSVIKEMIHRGEPATTLFRGLPPALIRTFPASAMYMFSYELVMKYLHNERHLPR
ncbi:mitochondrial carnitine/acylcarnitine carrier protein-like [Amphiura filiformis]|uniref:mitochondrial carnitine/acylcarnitine carrier protein-like n=1 Tax=Amphiura filiformis TaxID=82378 RepID=UPI003B21187A